MAVLGMLAASGCATKRDLRDLQDVVRAEAARQDSVLFALVAEMRALQDSLEVEAGRDVDTRGGLARELRRIRDDLTVLTQLTQQIQRSVADVQRRMDRLESVGERPVVPTDRPRDLEPIVGDSGRRPAGADAADEAWGAAVEAFQRGQLSTARLAFQRFVEMFPDHRLAPRGLYMLGDVLEQEGRLEEAVQQFLLVQERYPDSDQVPQAYYRVGLLYVLLDEKDRAREYFQRVIVSYPESSVATLAEEELRKLGGGGR
ncbi:MAG: hypothetical protein D6701_06550 [Gemmatimonadetes bacterium]|nr:MAG: hypothetical protein D6701_06550 [Gemmatimonadota bacterium]